MIVERSTTPLPLEERPIEELTREEMAELLRRQQVSMSKAQRASLMSHRNSSESNQSAKRRRRSNVKAVQLQET
jgi:hypothetical protein